MTQTPGTGTEPSPAAPAPDAGARAPADVLGRAVRPAMVGTGVLFVGYAVWDLASRWQPVELDVSLPLVALALVPVLGGPLIQGFAWTALLRTMTGQRPPLLPALVLYLDSQLGRYLPGKVGLPAVRVAGAARVGAPPLTVGVSVLVEMLSWLAVGFSLGFALLAATNRHAAGVLALLGRFGVPLLLASIAGLVVLLVVDRRRLPAAVRARLAVGERGPLLPVVLPAFHVLYWGTWALHGYLVTSAVTGRADAALAAPGLFVLGPVLGFLAAFAPAGVGVREAIFAAGLAPMVGAPAALTVALISRGLSIAADLLSWAGVRAVAMVAGRRARAAGSGAPTPRRPNG